jgi:Ser/Thr protein kinase RdoA (MazF antagonist)
LALNDDEGAPVTATDSAPYHEALAAVSDEWGIAADGIELLRAGQNHVYGGRLASGKTVIIRVTDDRHRAAALIRGELSWLTFLSENGCAVPTPLPGRDGRLLITRRGMGRTLHVVCFDRLDGSVVRAGDDAQWTPTLFRDLGRALGRIHRLNASYRPGPGTRRYVWYQETEYRHLSDYRRRLPSRVLDAIESHIAALRQWPATAGTYGLIHNDVYADNFLYKDGQVQLFDFDQACYGWYVYDLISPLYPHYVFPAVRIPGATVADAASFFADMVEGYRTEHRLTASQLAGAGDLLRLKEILVYLIVREQFEQWAETLHVSRASLRAGFAAVEDRLLNNKPVIDLDFTKY